MDAPKRALRRHYRWRKVQRMVARYRAMDQRSLFGMRSGFDARGLAMNRRKRDPEKLADNPATCRRFGCCGHRLRAAYGPPFRELRQMLREHDEAA